MKEPFNPIFIGGAGRSGTTLMRRILCDHPNLIGGEEFKLLPSIAQLYSQMTSPGFKDTMDSYLITDEWINYVFQSFIENLFYPYRHRLNNKRLVEKTPHNILAMNELGKIFPQAKFIHMIRDGRDVAKSLTEQQWIDLDGSKIWYTENIKNAGTYWGHVVTKGIMDMKLTHLQNRVLLVKYEDLVNQPEETLKRIMKFINEPWSEQILKESIYKRAVFRWKKEYTEEEQTAFVSSGMNELLIALGYEKKQK